MNYLIFPLLLIFSSLAFSKEECVIHIDSVETISENCNWNSRERRNECFLKIVEADILNETLEPYGYRLVENPQEKSVGGISFRQSKIGLFHYKYSMKIKLDNGESTSEEFSLYFTQAPLYGPFKVRAIEKLFKNYIRLPSCK